MSAGREKLQNLQAYKEIDMVNPASIFKIKSAWEKFASNHPKFPMFLQAAMASGIKENYIIEVKITDPEGKQICTNVKLTESDMELFHTLKDLKG
jgi:hypothetical protein